MSENKVQPTAPTSGAAWVSQRKSGVLVPLPSGNAARIRRTFDLIELLKAGKLPNPLATIIEEKIRSDEPTVEFDLATLPEQAAVQMANLIDEQIFFIFVDPVVVPVPEGENPATWSPDPADYDGKNVVSIADIDYLDRMFAFGFAQGGVGEVAPFLERQSQGVPTRQNGRTVQDQPSGDTAD
jgi:hypothetical protein